MNTDPLRDMVAVALHKMLCDGRHDDTDGPCWTAWRDEADTVMVPVGAALESVYDEGYSDGNFDGQCTSWTSPEDRPYRNGGAI